MQKNINETFTHYTVEFIDESISGSDVIPNDLISEFVFAVEKRNFQPSILFEINDDIEYSGNELGSFNQSVKEISSFPENSHVRIKLSIEKKGSDLQIFDPLAFVESLKKYSLCDQLSLVEKNIFDRNIQMDEQIIIHETVSSHIKDIKLVSNIESIYKDIVKSTLSPFYIDALAHQLPKENELRSYLVQLRDRFSLALITDRVEFSNLRTTYHFSSDKKAICEHDTQALEVTDYTFEVMTWIFEDDSYNIKKAIFNNVMLVQANTLTAINSELLSVLKSNLRILYKDKFADYIDAKNGITDFLFELSNKLKDEVNSNINASTHSVLAVLSFYFTSTIFTAIDKGKFVNIFTYEVAIMSSIFVIGAMLYLAFHQRQFENYLTFHLTQKDEFRERYSDVFSTEELNRLFSPPSLVELVKCAESRAAFFTFQIFLAFLAAVAWISHVFLTA